VPLQKILAIEAGEEFFFPELADLLGLSFNKLLSIYNNSYSPPESPEKINEELALKRFVVDVEGVVSNAYVLARGHYGLFVDAVGASREALHFAQDKGVEPRFLLITHGHFDHIAGVEQSKKKYPGINVFNGGRDIKNDTHFETNGFSIDVFKTQGHTEDSVCYFVNSSIVFVGDTIFAGSVGRANFSYEALLQNIKEKLFTLQGSVILAPGHGPLTTVGYEKKHNPFF
jgi:glyoxylase-like metal-dependent hydrolase (beta-lactamase superfamily II)